jgi:hypothetical protein
VASCGERDERLVTSGGKGRVRDEERMPGGSGGAIDDEVRERRVVGNEERRGEGDGLARHRW